MIISEEKTQNGFRRYCLGRDQEQLLLPSEEEGREEAFLHRALQPPPNQLSEKQWIGQEEGRGHLRCRRQQGICLHHQEGQRRQQARQVRFPINLDLKIKLLYKSFKSYLKSFFRTMVSVTMKAGATRSLHRVKGALLKQRCVELHIN